MDIETIYTTFRHVQSLYNEKPYKLPKDIQKHIEEKMTKSNKECMSTLCHWFNTKWINIDLKKYFEAGFELFGKGFSYNKFFDPKIVRLYVQLDKNRKRLIEIDKKNIIESFKYLKTKGLSLSDYCNKLDGNLHFIVEDYLKGNVDKILLTFLINYKYIRSLTDEDRQKIPYIITKWREHLEVTNSVKNFIEKCIEKIYS